MPVYIGMWQEINRITEISHEKKSGKEKFKKEAPRKNLKNSTINSAESHINYLEGERGGYGNLSEDIYNYIDDDTFKDDLVDYIDKYFESHKDNINYLSYNFSSLVKSSIILTISKCLANTSSYKVKLRKPLWCLLL